MIPTRNAHEDSARMRKVLKLVALFRRHEFTAAMVQRMNDQQWSDVSLTAGVNPPSAETKAAVIAHLQAEEPARAA